MRKLTGPAAGLAFLGCIIAANYVVTRYGQVPVGFGLHAFAGVYFAGLTFVLRDAVQDSQGRRVTVVLIVAGAALSAIVSPQVALASGAAFLVSETCDLAVYTPLRKRGYLRAALASNVVGSVVDSLVFLLILGAPLAAVMPGQVVGKLGITAAVVVLVAALRITVRAIRALRAVTA